ncbi:orotidine-5 -phosphate decarboxylase [Ophiostoma piceae UAMH 11346]|uniref:Orotidine 5'-phosphate decarboxylase n=1 Tax=Ophiostoma piceae (strain UAMH 11346) TaxID=1262450 RepID=S3CC08_OPHP1|nr:orotidine-5 -phosphate decarboxylase [Ophiostoma piceae UAMH 11346]
MAAAPHPSFVTPFAERAEAAVHPLTAYLYRLMIAKSSNLCLSADVSTARELLLLADRVGPSIVVLKTHYDLVTGWDYNPQTGTGAQLSALARKHGFLLFEDRKFADIGKTVQQQYTAGTARIIDWAHLVTVNMDAGAPAVTALADAAAHWRERVHYEVKTSVTVGTPVHDSFDDSGSGTPSGVNTPNVQQSEFPPPSSAFSSSNSNYSNTPTARQAVAFTDSIEGSSFNTDTGLPTPAPRDSDGRKGSIVSVTTVTQSFEPVDSPRLPRDNSTGSADGLTSGPNGTSSNEGGRSGSGKGSNAMVSQEVFSGIEEAPLDRGILLLAQMSTKGNLMTPAYTQACVDAARAHKTFVVGFIAQQTLNTEPDDAFVHLTPGCKLPPPGEDIEETAAGQIAGDGMGQQYNTPARLIGICGADIVIVGRGIITAVDPPSEAERYRRKAWKAYLARVQQ